MGSPGGKGVSMGTESQCGILSKETPEWPSVSIAQSFVNCFLAYKSLNK